MTQATDAPALVQRAWAVAREAGFPLARDDPGHGRGSASLPDTGRFLAVLAAGCTGGRIAELGTGVGIAAAWMSDAMPADCMLVTAEIDPARAAAAASLLARDARVRVLVGDASVVLAPFAPFDLIFCDSGLRQVAGFRAVVDWLRPGGRIVMDDVTPIRALSADSPSSQADPKREMFAAEARLTWTEVVLPDLENSLLVGTRR